MIDIDEQNTEQPVSFFGWIYQIKQKHAIVRKTWESIYFKYAPYCLSDRELNKTIVHWYKIINLFQYVSFSFVLLIQ